MVLFTASCLRAREADWFAYGLKKLEREIELHWQINHGIVGVVVTWIVATDGRQFDPPRVRFPDNAVVFVLRQRRICNATLR